MLQYAERNKTFSHWNELANENDYRRQLRPKPKPWDVKVSECYLRML